MVRPRKCRMVWYDPNITYFRPTGMAHVGEVGLMVDEFEAVRLKDLEGIEQEKAAERMNISQPTFHRLLVSARKKIADAIVNGKTLRIQGGNYEMMPPMRRRGRFGRRWR